MKTFNATVPIGLGDLIYLKAMFEPIKHEYESINIRFQKEIVTMYGKDPEYNTFINELGELLFGDPPFKISNESSPYYRLDQIATSGITARKPELSHLLCNGTPLNLEGEYLVLNTKVRSLPQSNLEHKMIEFWNTLNQLSNKYKIVILGEKVVEMSKEYQVYTSQNIYSLYPHILNNVPNEKLVDLTVPALGITAPNLKQIQQDCLIMNQAKFVINFGIGGGFCLTTAVANTIGYRCDDDLVADIVFSTDYPNAVVTKDWQKFIQTLGQYL